MNKSAFQIVRFVSEEAIREKLEKGDVPPESVEHLYDFGKLVAGQAHQVGTDLNAKLGNCLTWTSALPGMQLVSFSNGEHRLPLLLTAHSPLCSCGALILSYRGFYRSELLPSPSEVDWFKDSLLGDTGILLKYHVVSLLKDHQHSQHENLRKLKCMHRAERLLVLSALLTFLVVAFRVVTGLLSRPLLP